MKEYKVPVSGQASIVEHLQTYPETYFGISQHPLSIWNRSTNRVQNTMIEVLEILFQAIQDKSNMRSIVPNYELLLHQYSTLINDDTNKIIECFFGNDKVGNKLKKKAKMPNLQAHSSKIINALKHNQREMILVNHFWDGYIIPGFRIIKNDGKAYVLCDTIHYKPGDNVFGFYYELRYLFVGIHSLSDILCNTLPIGTSINIPPENKTESHSKITGLFLNLPSLYLPNEIKKEVPYIKLGLNENSEEHLLMGLRDKPDIIRTLPVKQISQETQ